MSCEQRYPAEVFFVDGDGSHLHSSQHPNHLTWMPLPPAREKKKGHGKSWGFMGLNPGGALIALMLFMLVFTILGFEAYQILQLREKLKDIEKVRVTAEKSLIMYAEHGPKRIPFLMQKYYFIL